MPTPFAPSTLDELARRLERRRQSSAQLAASLRTDATCATSRGRILAAAG